MKKQGIGIAVVLFLAAWSPGNPSTEATLSILAQSNIYGAGLPSGSSMPSPSGGGGGVAPVALPIRPGENRVVTVSKVSGKLSFSDSRSTNGPDGNQFSYRIAAHRGISGFDTPWSGCLVGVFLEKEGPGASAPSPIDFQTRGVDFRSLAPEPGQVFYVGDGVTKDGYQQQFQVPPTAGVLYFGFADSYYAGAGPGFYGDNSGKVEITVKITSTKLDFPKVP
ncbi:MAG: hypothetical protein P1U87_22890 [Verrucomicrobiales bacterium]|nr:hypothetical protein [Verrucomicrobiales bacterium]